MYCPSRDRSICVNIAWACPLQRCQLPSCVDSSGSRNRPARDRKSTRLNSSHLVISYAVFCLKKKKQSNAHLSHSHQSSLAVYAIASSLALFTHHRYITR